MLKTCANCGDEFNPMVVFDGKHRHRDFGRSIECGPCGMVAEEDVERYIAMEEAPPGGGTKGSCEVTPITRSELGSAASGMGRHVLFSQKYQPIGCKK